MGDLGSALNWGMGLAIGIIMVGLGIIVWVFRDKWSDLKAILTLVALIAMLPMGAILIREKTSLFSKASADVTVIAVEVVNTGGTGRVVYLTLSDPAFAMGEFKDRSTENVKIVPPVGRTVPRLGHAFEIEVGEKGGVMTFVINGRKKGSPVVIK